MLLIDHQSGLFQLVRDIDLPILRAHVTALAKVAYLAKIPTFTTASVPDGPNGPLIPEIHRYNPDAVYIPRTRQINAWDNPARVNARVVQAGAMPIDTYAVLAELMSTWNRPEAMDFAEVMVDHIVPPYRAPMESYDKAQNVQKVGRETRLEHLEAAQVRT
jgi:hypothetical protein